MPGTRYLVPHTKICATSDEIMAYSYPYSTMHRILTTAGVEVAPPIATAAIIIVACFL